MGGQSTWRARWVGTGAVVGGLLGLRFGIDSIPEAWARAVARHEDLKRLNERFAAACERRWCGDYC